MRCSAPVGDAMSGAVARRSLSDRLKSTWPQTFKSDYSDRCRPPAETVAAMRAWMAEFGITRLARLTGLDSLGVPVWSAIRPNARTLAQSQGKGVDDASAMASAVMEAIEVRTAERDDLPARRASKAQLQREGCASDTIDILLSKGAQPIGDDEEVDWLEGEDLMTGQTVFVPYEVVGFSLDPMTARYWQTSDGLASGNTIWEAVFHGLCERVERDASTL